MLLIIPVLGANPDYQFNLAWKGPHYVITGFADLDGDSLCEILCTAHDETVETYTFVALDIYSNVLGRIRLEGIHPSRENFEVKGKY